MIRLFIWIIFIYAIYYFVKTAIRGAVRKGIRDYEAQKDAEQQKRREVKVDRKNIEDAKYKDL